VEKKDPSYVIAFDRMYFGKNDIAKTAEKILMEAETKIKAKISLVLGDGGFDDIDTMKMFYRRKKPFIVRADQDKKVKEIISKTRKKGKNFHIEYGYLKGTEKNGVKANLIIETGYRDISAFQAKTHSLSDPVRLFLYIQAILLYNLWVQINYMFKDDPERIRYFRDGIPKSMVKFIIEQSILKEEYEGMEEGPLIK
jgi:hypothetical protein